MHPLADTGRVIAGRYRLEAPIGRGAMGVVWRARDLLLDRDVAVKEVQIAETLTDEERANAYQRTLREAKTAARLNHPGVVTVYDVAEDEGRPWIVMQLVSAQSLDQVLATSGPLSPRRTAEVGRQLLSALSVAHAAGVMHRDVKPSNVLLGRDDRAVLTDFGIATFQGDPRLTQTGMVMGSPGFTAPERIRGEDATPASDLWSLGATLFAAVEGHGPFERRGGAITTMSAIINEDAPPAPAAGALGPVITALLRRDPADRPDASTATRMITDVLPLLPAGPGPEPPGYEATALSASSRPRAPVPGETSLDAGSADHTGAEDPLGSVASAGTHGGDPAPSGTAATTPQPVLGGAARCDQAAHELPTEYRDPGPPDQPATHYDPKGRWGAAGAGSGSAAPPPPDFSSWYDPSPRSGPAPSAQPWRGAAYQAGSGSGSGSGAGSGSAWSGSAAPPAARPDYRSTAPPPRKRRGGLWLALALLAVLGAGAGAAAIVLLRHNTTGSSGGTLPPASLQIVDAINDHPGALPSGWTTVTHQATGTETAGFTIDAPARWMPSTTGYQTYITDPSANANILIDLTPHTILNDMVAEARFIKSRSLTEGRFPGYSQAIGGLAATPIRGTRGAWWKFTWDDKGVTQEAIDLLFVLHTQAGAQSYALYMTAPASMWNQMRPIFDEEVETFAHLP
jgi:eukaryotic-like serine/threonine-protein kinase